MLKIQYKACNIRKNKNIILTLKSIDKYPEQESDNLHPSTGQINSLDKSMNFSGFQLPANEKFEKDNV